MELHNIKKLAFELLGNKHAPDSNEKGEKYYHGERVASLAIKLRKRLYPDDFSHDEILIVSAWFHDILNGIENHSVEGAKKAKEVLSPFCTESELGKICNIISVHDDRNSERNYSKYIKLHQDADFLDHFGVIDIWRSFIYAVPHDRTMPETLEYMTKIRPAENEKYRCRLNYEISKKLFDERIDFYQKFTERFKIECAGEIFDEEKLLRNG